MFVCSNLQELLTSLLRVLGYVPDQEVRVFKF